MASGLSPTINYLPGTYFGCLDKSAAAVFRASPDKVLRVLDSPELLAHTWRIMAQDGKAG